MVGSNFDRVRIVVVGDAGNISSRTSHSLVRAVVGSVQNRPAISPNCF